MAAGTVIKHKRKAGAFTGGDLAAGELGVDTSAPALYFSKEGTSVTKVGATSLSAVLSADFVKNNATLANVTDLTLTLLAGHTYFVTFSALAESYGAGLSLVDFDGGTATVVGVRGHALCYDFANSILSPQLMFGLGNGPGGGGVGEATFVRAEFTVEVNAGGTLVVRYAQANTDASDSLLHKYAALTALDIT